MSSSSVSSEEAPAPRVYHPYHPGDDSDVDSVHSEKVEQKALPLRGFILDPIESALLRHG